MNGLHNFQPSKIELKKEDYQDRMIMLLKARGYTNKRVAEELGVTEAKVNYTVRQPWFMEQLLKYLHEKGDDAVEKMLQIVEKDAIQVAYEIMMNSQNEKLRATAAFEFIKANRGTKLVVENRKMPLKQLKEEEARLEEEISLLERNRVQDMKPFEPSGN